MNSETPVEDPNRHKAKLTRRDFFKCFLPKRHKDNSGIQTRSEQSTKDGLPLDFWSNLKYLSRRDFLKLATSILGSSALPQDLFIPTAEKALKMIGGKTVFSPERQQNIMEVPVNPLTFDIAIELINGLPEQTGVKMVMDPGLYRLPRWENKERPLIRSDDTVTYGSGRLHHQVRKRSFIAFEAKNEDEKPTIEFDGEIGFLFDSCEEVRLNAIKFKGGMVRKKQEANYPKETGPLDSQVLIKDAGKVMVTSCEFEGVPTPYDTPDELPISSIIGLCVLNTGENPKIATQLEVSSSKFTDTPWDAILCRGKVKAEIKNSEFSRTRKPYFTLKEGGDQKFYQRVGSAVACLDGAELSVHDCYCYGYNKIFMINNGVNTIIDNVQIKPPKDWFQPYEYTAYWVFSVVPLRKNESPKGSLSINNLAILPVDESKWQTTPYFHRVFFGLDYLERVDIKNSQFAIHEADYADKLQMLGKDPDEFFFSRDKTIQNLTLKGSKLTIIHHPSQNFTPQWLNYDQLPAFNNNHIVVLDFQPLDTAHFFVKH